jgi:hypothetical protein
MLMTEPYPVVRALQEAITACATAGWRLQSVTGTTAIMVSGGGQVKTYWGLHLFLFIITLGLWTPFWLTFAILGSRKDHTERSLLLVVNELGNVSYHTC